MPLLKIFAIADIEKNTAFAVDQVDGLLRAGGGACFATLMYEQHYEGRGEGQNQQPLLAEKFD